MHALLHLIGIALLPCPLILHTLHYNKAWTFILLDAAPPNTYCACIIAPLVVTIMRIIAHL